MDCFGVASSIFTSHIDTLAESILYEEEHDDLVPLYDITKDKFLGFTPSRVGLCEKLARAKRRLVKEPNENSIMVFPLLLESPIDHWVMVIVVRKTLFYFDSLFSATHQQESLRMMVNIYPDFADYDFTEVPTTRQVSHPFFSFFDFLSFLFLGESRLDAFFFFFFFARLMGVLVDFLCWASFIDSSSCPTKHVLVMVKP